MNRKNLKKLADYLADLPEGGPKFDMDKYYYSNKVPERPYGLEPNTLVPLCGTSACAVGHATHVEGLEAFDDEGHWQQYIRRIFDMEEFSIEYHWCFSSRWYDYDNTAKGASKRINYFLKNGLPSGFGGRHDINHPCKALYQ